MINVVKTKLPKVAWDYIQDQTISKEIAKPDYLMDDEATYWVTQDDGSVSVYICVKTCNKFKWYEIHNVKIDAIL
jgi:hypothetical protein